MRAARQPEDKGWEAVVAALDTALLLRSCDAGPAACSDI